MATNPDRVPPSNPSAEASAICSMLIDGDAALTVSEILAPDDFYDPRHRLIYEALQGMLSRQGAVDAVLLREELSRTGTLDKAGGAAYLAEILRAVSTPAHAEHYARIVLEKGMLRGLIGCSTEIIHGAYETDVPAEEYVDEAEKKFFEATHRRTASRTSRIDGILHETFKILSEKDERLRGFPTGFPDLDDLIGGLRGSDLIVLAARPSMGKTTMALNMVRHAAVELKRPCLIFSLEMSKRQVTENILCGQARVNAAAMRKGFISDRDWSKLSDAGNILHDTAIFIDDTPGLTVLECRAKARRLKARENIQLVVVDYLQLMEGRTGRRTEESRVQEISMVSRGLKGIARELDVPVIAISQLSRAPEQREGNKPRLSDLRDSGSIEQDADLVLLLYRDEYYHRDDAEERGTRNMAELMVAKNRHGPVDDVKLTFLADILRFESYARPGA